MTKAVFRYSLAILAGTMSLAASPTLAQKTKASSIDLMVEAEHAQWMADHEAWHAEHLDIAKRLERLAAKLRAEDAGFDGHDKELKAHRETIAKSSDPSSLAKAHARLAANHAETRIAHHELVDAVANLEKLMVDDAAADQREVAAAR
jgi:hypothetical protein